jgi:hypothetical protein
MYFFDSGSLSDSLLGRKELRFKTIQDVLNFTDKAGVDFSK